MNLADVIENLVEERGLDREQIAAIVCDGIQTAYTKKYPYVDVLVTYNKKTGQVEILAEKEVVNTVEDPDTEITLRRAKMVDAKAELGSLVHVPFEQEIGRVEIITAKQIISAKIRELEHMAVYNEFKDRKGAIIIGAVHKRERAGMVVKIGEVLALLPNENIPAGETIKVGHQVRVLVQDVLVAARGDYQIILDRASADFVKGLIELEIPEVYEGIVEIKKIVRTAGYKTKAIVASTNKDIDPVGTCVGVGGARIKPILRELGQEKVDLIEATDELDDLVKDSLKPADIDKVEVNEQSNVAMVWLAQDQRSLAIGKLGQNITLASKLTGLEIHLQDIQPQQPRQGEGYIDQPFEKEDDNEDSES
ncbi:transcription termination factor NusA [Candidatus Babeliales bacterium]|nr:transcription termination factor NusA [Candidatus Babeliales bacterium]MBY0353107.1 transcription termination factor NusA [Candidatus Babeliales bacterium]